MPQTFVGRIAQALRLRLPVLLLLAGFWVAVTSFLIWDYQQVIHAGNKQSRQLSESLATHAEQVLNDAKRLGYVIEHEVQRSGLHISLRHFLPPTDESNQAILQLALVDPDGVLRASTVEDFEPIDLSDREHIQVHFGSSSTQLFISKPLIGRTSGRLSIQLSRRLVDKQGKTLGILVISIDPVKLTERYSQLDLGSTGLIALVGRNDGVVRMIRSQTDWPGIQVGGTYPELLSSATAPQSTHTGSMTAQTLSLSREQFPKASQALLLSAAPVAHYPLEVIVGLSRQDILAPYTLRRHVLLGAAVLLTFLAWILDVGRSRIMRRAQRSDRKLSRALDKVSSRERRLANLFNAIPDPAIAFSMHGTRVEGFNPPMARLTGWDPQSSARLDIDLFARQVFAPDVSPHKTEKMMQFSAQLKTALNASNTEITSRFELQIDTPAPFIYEVRLERLHEAPKGLLVLLRDITAQHRLERMTNDFAATAAHELRTPLASIVGFSELLAANLVPESSRTHVAEQIWQRASTMSELVSDLLTLTRLDTGQGSGRHHTFDLRTSLDTLLKSWPEAEQRLRLTLPDDPVMVSGNPSEMVTALRNAVGNAIKYDTTGQTIHVSMAVDSDTRQVHIVVKDLGPGMPRGDTENVFKRFVRLHPAGNIEGSGLGLPLIRSILQHHKGWAWILSEPGQGVELHMSLPVADSRTKQGMDHE